MNASGDRARRIVRSDAELSATIADVRALGRPTILFLEDEGAGCLALGIGAALSVMAFVRPGGESFHSLGDASRKDVVRFWCREQLDDFMAETAVPEETAIAAAYEFLRTRQQPSTVRWEADW
jgi:hypothetical protein